MSVDTYEAVMIAEGVEEADAETYLRAWRMLVDTGLCWSLQGWFGRTATALIEAGHIDPPQGDPPQERQHER